MDIKDKLSKTERIKSISYESQEENMKKWIQDLEILDAYTIKLEEDIKKYIDDPLKEGFNQKANDYLERASIGKVSTENTLDIRENPSEKRVKSKLTFEDFLGYNPNDDVMYYDINYEPVSFTKGPTQIVGGFARLYEECYNNYITENGLNEEELTLNEFLAEHLNSGEFYHKKDQPFLEFLSSLSDILILPAVIKMLSKYDFITGEELTDVDVTMLGITTIINVFSIASAIHTAGGSLTGAQALKTVLIEMAADAAATSIVYVGDEIGLPKPISMLFALGGGIAVGKLGTKYFITTNDKIIFWP